MAMITLKRISVYKLLVSIIVTWKYNCLQIIIIISYFKSK